MALALFDSKKSCARSDSMPNYNIGAFIKYRRIELKVSQSELSRGICNVGTLSRIENGEHLPRNEILEQLLQRLGYFGNVFDGLLIEEDFKAAETVQRAKNLTSFGKVKEAKALVDSLNISFEGLRSQDRQFCDRLETVHLRSIGAITNEQALERFIGILERSSGSFDIKELPTVLSSEEMCLLNNIAICYANTGKTETAIKILYHMKRICEGNIVDYYESMKSLPGILYNLSKCLGQSGRFDESIAICEYSIEMLTRTGWLRVLPQTMYTLGVSLVKRGKAEDTERARKVLDDAYQLSLILSGESKRTNRIRKFISENFTE